MTRKKFGKWIREYSYEELYDFASDMEHAILERIPCDNIDEEHSGTVKITIEYIDNENGTNNKT